MVTKLDIIIESGEEFSQLLKTIISQQYTLIENVLNSQVLSNKKVNALIS